MITSFTFFDDFCLQQRHQLKRRFFTLNPIWDSGYNDPLFRSSYSTIRYIPDEDKYYMWASLNTVFCNLNNGISEQCILALAESKDGIHYERSEGTVSGFDPVKNVVYAGFGHSIHGPTVLFDPEDPDPQRRFKCAAALDEPGRIMAYSPCIISTSPDGKHWAHNDCKYTWSNYWSDSYNTLIWNPVLKCYQVFCRAVGTDRRICTVTSKDLIHWSEPRLIIHPDTMDAPGTEFYGMPVHYHNGIFYGYLWIFDTDDEDPVAYKMAGRMRCELTYSYDGLCWLRTRQSPVSFNDYEGAGYGVFDYALYNTIMNKNGDMWLTAGTFCRGGHGENLYISKDPNHLPSAMTTGDPEASKRLISTIKPGRFCGLESIGLSGRLRTKNFLLDKDGEVPVFNVACPFGEMRVQLCDTRNRPVKGFTFADSVPFRGNELAYKPLWKEHCIEETRGKLYNMEVELYNGCIFAVTGSMKPFHSALPQFSYGNVNSAAKEVWGTLEKAPDYDALELVSK